MDQRSSQETVTVESSSVTVVEGKIESQEQAQKRKRKLLKDLLTGVSVYVLLLLCFSFLFIVHATPLVFHEVFGLLIFVVVITHVVLLRSFFSFVREQRQPVFIYRDVVLLGLAIAFILAVISGIAYSHVLLKDVISLPGSRRMWHDMHTVSTSYLLIFIGLHLGCYAQKFATWLSDSLAQLIVSPAPLSAEDTMADAVKRAQRMNKTVTWIKRFLGGGLALISVNGIVQFVEQSFFDKLIAQRSFSFYDFESSWLSNAVNQLSIMMLFMAISALLYWGFLHLSAKKD